MTLGKVTFDIGKVSIDVAIGEFSQATKDLSMRTKAVMKPHTTTKIQNTLLNAFRVVEI